MRLTPVMLMAVAFAVATVEVALAQYCEYCLSGEVYCNVVIEYPEQYTDDAQDECNDEGPDHLIDIHAFTEWGDCDGGELSSLPERGASDGLVARTVSAVSKAAVGGDMDGCRACGWTSECHDLSDLGSCHEGCLETLLTVRTTILAYARARDTDALVETIGTVTAVEFVPSARPGQSVLKIRSLCAGHLAEEGIPIDPSLATALEDQLGKKATGEMSTGI